VLKPKAIRPSGIIPYNRAFVQRQLPPGGQIPGCITGFTTGQLNNLARQPEKSGRHDS